MTRQVIEGCRQTIRDVRLMRKILGHSETAEEAELDLFWNLPFASKKGVLRDSWPLLLKFVMRQQHRIFTHLTDEEKVILYILASKLKRPCTAVEIGSFLGSSACFIALGLSKNGRLYCVDTWLNDAMDEFGSSA